MNWPIFPKLEKGQKSTPDFSITSVLRADLMDYLGNTRTPLSDALYDELISIVGLCLGRVATLKDLLAISDDKFDVLVEVAKSQEECWSEFEQYRIRVSV